MLLSPDAASTGKIGRLTVNVSMIVFMVLLVIMWILMGIQIYSLHKKRLAESSDPETGVRVPVAEDDTPLDDLRKSTKGPKRQSERTSMLSFASWSTTETFNSRKSAQEQRVGSLFRKIAGALKKQTRRE